jgi:hypothetical protein
MSSETKIAWRTRGWFVIIALILYPLSLGPAAFIDGAAGPRSGVARKAVGLFFSPLGKLCDLVPPLDHLLTSYATTCHEAGNRFGRSVSQP